MVGVMVWCGQAHASTIKLALAWQIVLDNERVQGFLGRQVSLRLSLVILIVFRRELVTPAFFFGVHKAKHTHLACARGEFDVLSEHAQ
jgi:hypothetical protein